jgi:hypothetical protein
VEHELLFLTSGYWATGIVSKSLKNICKDTRTIFNRSIQKTAVLGTSHVVRNVLQSETWNLSGGAHDWFKRRGARKRKPLRREQKYDEDDDDDDDDEDNNNDNNNNNILPIFGSKIYCDERAATYGGSGVLLKVIMGRESKAQ